MSARSWRHDLVQAGWRDSKLGNLFEIKHGYAFKSEFYGDAGEYVLLTPGNFREEGGLKLKGVKEKFYNGHVPKEFILCKGDLLIAMTDLTQNAPILGSPAFIPETGRFLHNQRLGRVVNWRSDQIDPRFLYYLLNTSGVRAQIKGSATGSTVRHTSPSRIGEVSVRIPHVKLQAHIADILSAFDDLIENNLQRIRILEEMVRALYREWFVEFHFPGHGGVRRAGSPIGSIPEGWSFKTLDQVAEVNRAQINRLTAPREIHYIDISAVSPGHIDKPTTYAFADAPGRARRIVQHGDIVWSCVRPNRRSHALVLWPRAETVASTGFAVLTATRVPFTFLYCATTTDEFVHFLANNATGAAYPAVTAKTFEGAQLLVPPETLLEAFGRATTPMAEEVHVLERQCDNLRFTRDLVLPRLLSGQIGLNDPAA